MNVKEYFIAPKDDGRRLDRYLEEHLGDTRSQWKKRIEEGFVTVDGKSVKSGWKLKTGMKVVVKEKPAYRLRKKEIPFSVFYEDEFLAVVDKPRGLVVHPGAGEEEETLVHGLLYRFESLSRGTEDLRPGIVHRLDKDTDGLMVIAKTDAAQEELVKVFKERKITKEYYAVVHGIVREQGEILTSFGRSLKDRKKMAVVEGERMAKTSYRPLGFYGNFTLLAVRIFTGRTHQIRVHMAHIGHPVVGDELYGFKKNFGIRGQLLTSFHLAFHHPLKGVYLDVQKGIPKEISNFLRKV